MLDDKFPDHIGWRLWQASNEWNLEFVARMQAAGHGWFTAARSSLIGHIAPKGTKQGSLVDRIGISKQAIQQLVDGLEDDGILERVPDADDKRSRIVRLTEAGRAAMKDANRIKIEIESGYRERIGSDEFALLSELLGKLSKR
ncbi:MarR family winged helix-turn-helix transcriptional regulator [Rhizobium sp. LjRoot254]|uniref:MarR family winged helix-turn-helix transcriptional regulator n=1 Tax=Rhizobium sp. LjRoot254 TaxID=3342297 RepID=UPI003ECFBEC1